MDDPPLLQRYSRHLIMCTGSDCDPEGRAQKLYRRLPSLLDDLARYENPGRVKRGTTSCLGVCSGGPLLVVYPEGVWYHHVDDALLERIVREHLRDGQPVVECIFHQLAVPTNDESDGAPK